MDKVAQAHKEQIALLKLVIQVFQRLGFTDRPIQVSAKKAGEYLSLDNEASALTVQLCEILEGNENTLRKLADPNALGPDEIDAPIDHYLLEFLTIENQLIRLAKNANVSVISPEIEHSDITYVFGNEGTEVRIPRDYPEHLK